MKHRIFVLFLAAMLLLTACGAPAAEEPAETVEAPVAEEPAPVEVPEETPVEEPVEAEPIEEAPVEEEAVEEEVPAGPTVDDALAFVDQDVTALYAAIGEPVSSSYEYSCSGPGDDGILTYDGFIVFTYREKDGSAETVVDAEAE